MHSITHDESEGRESGVRNDCGFVTFFPTLSSLKTMVSSSSSSTNTSSSGTEPLITFSQLRDAILGPEKGSVRRDTIIIPNTLAGQSIKSRDEVRIERVMESCTFKATLSGVLGFGLGAALGLFSASVGPEATMTAPEQQTAKAVLRDMGSKSFSMAKNFGILGLMFAATECTVESVRISFLLFLCC